MVQFYPIMHKRYDESIKLSLDEARELGITVYWTGEPCVRGHMAHRNIKTKRCVICQSEINKKTHHKMSQQLSKKESEQAGINPEIRRKIEQEKEDIKLMHELEDF